ADPVDLVLEPWGRVYSLQPGEPRMIGYAGDLEPQLSLEVAPGEIKVWAEGAGELTLTDPTV
ncbi:hypothetical protein ABTM23_19765, partial [Acinetobacter baumannii]